MIAAKAHAATEGIMPIDIDEIIERAFEHAFAKAREQIVQSKAETLFQKGVRQRFTARSEIGE